MTHTLSFCILDDLRPIYGQIHVQYSNIEELRNEVMKILVDLKKSGDPTGYYVNTITLAEIDETIRCLTTDKYEVWNRFEKYYVIAWAIDYTRFEVYSKDYDKKLIKWREHDENDPIVGIVDDPAYNENPVIKLVQELNGRQIV